MRLNLSTVALEKAYSLLPAQRPSAGGPVKGKSLPFEAGKLHFLSAYHLLGAFLLLGLASGCVMQKPQFNVKYAWYMGSNAVLLMRERIQVGGYYTFTMGFPSIDRNHFLKEGWPPEMKVNLHLVANTNGSVALDTRVVKMGFSDYSPKRKLVEYNLPGFEVPQGAAVECTLSDENQGPRRACVVEFFQAIAK